MAINSHRMGTGTKGKNVKKASISRTREGSATKSRKVVSFEVGVSAGSSGLESYRSDTDLKGPKGVGGGVPKPADHPTSSSENTVQDKPNSNTRKQVQK